MMSLEYLTTEINIIVWNTVCDDIANGKSLFQEICANGLEWTTVPDFTIVTNKKEQKFFKVNHVRRRLWCYVIEKKLI